MNMSAIKVSALGLALITAVGCGVELEGEEGELTFRYLGSELQSSAASGALATGASVDVELRAVDGEDALTIKDAFSESSDIIEVLNVTDRQFTLMATEAGTARIGAEAEGADGETLSDSVEIESAEVARVSFDSVCTDDVFVTDSGARFTYRMYDASDNQLTGYGVYPVTVEPSEGGTVNESSKLINRLDISTGSDAGEYQLVSDLGDPHEFTVVAPDQITNVSIDENAEDTAHHVSVGEEVAVALFTMEADGRSVCGPAGGAFELTTETSEICSPSYNFFGSVHFIEVEGLSQGDCEISMIVPGTDIEHSFSVEVQ